MNRIILIGNGFDLANGLKTSYKHFIDNFWEQKKDSVENYFNERRERQYRDNDIEVNNLIGSTSKFHYNAEGECGYERFIHSLSRSRIQGNMRVINKFLKHISEKNSLQSWVDIEEEYYALLVQCAKDQQSVRKEKLIELNREFESIKKYLIEYLIEEEKKNICAKDTIVDKIYSSFNKRDFMTEINVTDPERILFLNFNYTTTNIRHSFSWEANKILYENIHIHGRLEDSRNPVIFGYGDETGQEYAMIENLNDNDFLENMKSIKYLETDNYKQLSNFIDSDNYQIFIFGHSCGKSDRTLLKILFEHKNCISIKVFYYKPDEKDNFSDIIRNISRHFSDKTMMRRKVVNKKYSETLL